MMKHVPQAFALALLLSGIVIVTNQRPAMKDGRPHEAQPFQLIEAATHEPYTSEQLHGRVTAVFFGFTSCPDVCPMALSTASRWLALLGSDAERLRFVFITVDPERDTPERLAQYVAAFDPRIVALTGAPDQIDTALRRLGAFAERRPGAGDDYMFDHSASIFLVGRDGQLAGALDFEQAPDLAVARLRKLIGPEDGPALTLR